MTIDELMLLHESTCQEARDIMRAKNHDYTAGSDDPFANFRASEALGVPAVVGVLVRSIDKFQRIRSFVERGELKVKGESVDDAIRDVVNYMILARGLVKDEQANLSVVAIQAN
jgi:hypothetical protein